MATSVQLVFRPDGVAVFTIDQAGSKVNVLTSELWTDLEAAVDAVTARTDVKGLVIASGKPGVFIAGADLKLLGNAPAPNDPEVRAFIEHGKRVLRKLEALPFPTCAAIDGAALGGGLEVALACDCRVLGTNPKIQLGLPEVKLGLIPGWGGTQRLPRIAGFDLTIQMILTGEPIAAEEAVSNGLAVRCPSGTDLVAVAAEEVVRVPAELRKLKQGSAESTVLMTRPTADSAATRKAFRVMLLGAALPLYDAIDLETEAFMQLAGSPDSKRLIAEFFASRKPASN